MAYANGRLPASALAAIPGSGPYGAPKLRADAAAAYNALHREAMRRWNISMALHESAVGRAYRSIARQYLAKRTYGRNAATPGYSNHGWGINVDLMNRAQRWVIDQIGHLYGFSKRWSDAAWEWWHITFKPGIYKARPVNRYPTLRAGQRSDAVARMQRLLRAKNVRGAPRATGYFGPTTKRALKRFQAKKGLPADGVCGPATWRALRR